MFRFDTKLSPVVIGIASVIWLVSAKALVLRNSDLRDEISIKRKELAYQKGILVKKDEFLAAHERIKKDFSQSKEPDEQMSLIISQLEAWAKEDGLILHDVRPVPAEDRTDIKLLKVDLELEGEMVNLTRFLYKIVSSKEPLEIERFSFSQKMKMKPEINLDLEVAFLYLE